MFKKINRRYVATFMAIVFLSFLTLTVMLGKIVSEYDYSMKQKLMDNTARSIASMINVSMRSGYRDFEDILLDDSEQIDEILNRNAENTDSIIFITDSTGKVIVKSDDPDSLIPSAIPHSTMNAIFSGEITISEEYGNSDLDGVFDKKYLNRILPIYLMPVSGDVEALESLGAIFICSENRNPIIASVGSTLAMTIGWVFVMSILAVYFIGERMTKPLKEMSRAAKMFAQGHFDVRVPVRGEDEIAELATAFNNMAMNLEKMEENRNTFLSNVSHDLRTPMTTISGFIDGILTGAIPPEKQEHYLEIVSGEVKRLSRLVASLLDITRLQSGDKPLVKTNFDVCEMARRVLISCEDRIEKKSLYVNFETDAESILAFADHDSIYQIIYNLVDNAVKFSYDKGKLEISIKRNEKRVFVSVKNTGAGIAKSELPFVFEQFYKSDKSRGLDKSGLGLGLYICKTIIDRHGEEMWVNSEEGAWCEFVFTLEKGK